MDLNIENINKELSEVQQEYQQLNPLNIDTKPKYRICIPCNKPISITNYYTHIKTEKHKKNKLKEHNDLLDYNKDVPQNQYITTSLLDLKQKIDNIINNIKPNN